MRADLSRIIGSPINFEPDLLEVELKEKILY